MLLWRLSGVQHAEAFDGGYGLLFEGRWNTIGHAVAYCATSPSLCVLEKLVHVEDRRSCQNSIECGTTRKPDQCGGRGTTPSGNLLENSSTLRSSSARLASGCDWSDAQAPIWLSRGRLAK